VVPGCSGANPGVDANDHELEAGRQVVRHCLVCHETIIREGLSVVEGETSPPALSVPTEM
jgi:hypothetical protein